MVLSMLGKLELWNGNKFYSLLRAGEHDWVMQKIANLWIAGSSPVPAFRGVEKVGHLIRLMT